MLQYRCISQPWTLMRFLVWKRGLLTVQSQGPIVRCTIDSDQGSSWEYENWVKVEAWHQVLNEFIFINVILIIIIKDEDTWEEWRS